MTNRFRLGIDIGGTFTDFSLMDEESGRLRVFKTPSTPSQPQRAVVNGIEGIVAEFGVAAAAIGYFVHGTTIAVNTVIERSGARTGILVTRGVRDLMTLGRSRLADTYSFLVERPEPLVPRHLVREIEERTLANGRVYQTLDEEQVRREAKALHLAGVEALAICFLHSYKNPEHEERARAIVAEACPGLYVCISSEVWPQMREYERALATLINAHVGPRMDAYFDRLLTEVSATGVAANVFSTKSNGGIMTVPSARRVPVQTLVSGPAAGVIGAQYVGRLAGFDKLFGLDMGGTSTDVAVVDGEILYSTDNTVGDFQVVLPAVDVSSIGAGGGSIAWTDTSGVLKVGPKSAGASPGPACYGLGGEQPAITDAYVVLGIVDPDNFLGGRMRLRPDLAHHSVGRIADVLGVTVVEAA
ncbi:MAG: hydantoinase/oxoprolinase family protein, partial [Chloroflexi bacterium]|nr:hydantoinase/oxoprolinase family protein [Chloroflexota bacterium]